MKRSVTTIYNVANKRAREDATRYATDLLPTEIWNLILCASGYEWKVPVERVCRLFRYIYGEMEKPKNTVKSYSHRDTEVFSTTFAAWALDNGAKWGEYACKYIVRRGDRELIQWASDNRCPFDKHACGAAARKGDLGLMKWLKSTGICNKMSTCFSNAAKGGHIDVIQYLKKEEIGQITLEDITLGWENAEEKGHINVLDDMYKGDFLIGYSGPPGWNAARCGQFDVIKWMTDNGIVKRDNPSTCEGAAHSGDLKILRWCLDNGYVADESMFTGAAISGNIEMLEWLLKGHYPWNVGVFFYAAVFGRMKVLAWLKKNKAPWDKYTRTGAYIGMKLDVLEWLKENEYPWNVDNEIKAMKGCNNSKIKVDKRIRELC